MVFADWRWRAAVLVVLTAVSVAAVGAGSAAAGAQGAQYDRFGRRLPPGAAPLLMGPLPGPAWPPRVDFGMELPIGVDAGALRRGLGPAFRMVLPRAGTSGARLDVVVENVRQEDVRVGGAAARAPARGSVVYTGTVRGRPDAVAVVSVVNDVLYCRLALGDEEWVVYSDPNGRTLVQVERRTDGWREPLQEPSFDERLPERGRGR